jgi:hypothetical protein
MQRSAIAFTGYLSLVVALMGACGPEPLEVPDPVTPPNTGGAGGAGGSGGTGGTGGSLTGGTGGSFTGGTGGVGGAGGAVGGAGGAKGGTGGATAGIGGATSGTGGAVAGTGGAAAGAGGSVGGAAGAGAGTAGTAGAAPVPCDAAFAVGADGFVRAPAAGGACWHGYASAGGDATSMAMPTSFAACGAGCMLRFSGTVGASVAPDYLGVVYMGFNLKQTTGTTAKGTVTPTGTGLAVQYTNTGASTIVRVQLSAGAVRWCAPLTSASTTIPYAMFNTECWEGGMGTAYAKEPIDTVQLIIPGGAADAAFDVTLVSVKDT